MLESLGHAVRRLIRIRYGAMGLPRGVKRGAWMELDDADIRALSRVAQAKHGVADSTQPGVSKAVRDSKDTGNALRSRPNGGRGNPSPRKGQSAVQPDPMKTSLGYIGVDSFTRQRQEARTNRGAGSGSSGGRRSAGRQR